MTWCTTGLGQHFGGPRVTRVLHDVSGIRFGNDYHRHVTTLWAGTNGFEYVETTQLGQDQIEDHHVGGFPLDRFQTCPAALRRIDAEAFSLQLVLVDIGYGRIV